MRSLVFFFLMIALSSVSFAITSTGFHKISLIQVNGKDGYYYFKTENDLWEADDCPEAVWAYVRPQSIDVADQILSVALAAKMSGTKVKFSGECDAGGIYFQADRINIE